MENLKIKSFEDLFAWKKSHVLAVRIYEVTRNFPIIEQFGLTSQMRRCVVSIVSNIAEGFSRKTYKDKSQFYSVSLGSVTELQSQLQISYDIGLVSMEIFQELDTRSIEVHKIINGLLKSSKNTTRI